MSDANRISVVRREKGVTLVGLAELAGVHFTTVARHQSGRITCPHKMMEQYAEILDVPLMELYVDPNSIPGATED